MLFVQCVRIIRKAFIIAWHSALKEEALYMQKGKPDGTIENPYEIIQDAIDTLDGTGKVIYVHNKDSLLVIEEEVE